MSLQWEQIDDRAVRTAKILAGDAVENTGNGHPGTAISLAPMAYLVYQRHLRFDPGDDRWLGRDRFVLSNGHASLTQYIQLYLAGAGLELEDFRHFRQYGTKTTGHPEFRKTKGIEITTGPLGSGFAAAVGMAMAARREHGLFDPETPDGQSIFDHFVYVVAGDGCLEEGITSEASSLAGTQELGNLILIYDDNHISIEDDTSVAFSEDVLARYAAYGWHTQRVDWLRGDGTYDEDVEGLDRAIEAAKAETRRPSIIALRTIIGWPTPGKQNTGAIHGSKLGSEALRGLKRALGADPDAMFAVDQEAVDHARENAGARAREAHAAWDPRYRAWRSAHPDRAALLDRLLARRLPEGWDKALPRFEPGTDVATRAASGAVLNAIGPVLPELWGGSADLAGSNDTMITADPSFFPADRSSKQFAGNEYGRNLHFGIREHAMGGILNGIAADGITRAYGATFLVFADYMRGAVRLAALMRLPVVYVWTHDSIGVGEDGPTHQPVEHLTAYRAIPNLAVVRPADAAETTQAWKAVLERQGPAALVLTRQKLPNPARGGDSGLANADGVARGAYVLADAPGTPDVILLASGSEVQLALAARATLAEEGVRARVVSVPCMEWFDAQDADYRASVLPPRVRARVSVEAGLAMPWRKYLGDAGRAVSIETFGAQGDGPTLMRHFGFTPEHVVQAARESLSALRD